MADKESEFHDLDPQLVAPLDSDQQRSRLHQLAERWNDEWAVAEITDDGKLPRGGVRLELENLDQLVNIVEESQHLGSRPDDLADELDRDDFGDAEVPSDSPLDGGDRSAYDELEAPHAAESSPAASDLEPAESPLTEPVAAESPLTEPVAAADEPAAVATSTDWNLFVVEVLKAYEEERFDVAYSMARRYLEHDPDHEDVQLVMMECQEKLGG